MEEVLIHIHWSDTNDGYMYDLYHSEEDLEECNNFDGGLCTGSFEDALEMATSHIINKK